MVREAYSPEELLVIGQAIDIVLESVGKSDASASTLRRELAARAFRAARDQDPIDLEKLLAVLRTAD